MTDQEAKSTISSPPCVDSATIQSVLDRARSWSSQDFNPATSSHVQDLIATVEAGDTSDNNKTDSVATAVETASKELTSLFPPNGERIGFGTAGLRSEMKPGPLGMNDLVIVQTTQGLARYCQSSSSSSNAKLRAVVGYDHRCDAKFDLSSRSFAILTTLVFRQADMECILLRDYVATPILAFATTYLNADVGVMITASHNPKHDNGYKVYWDDGCQIRPPLDADIDRYITRTENLVPWVDYGRIIAERKKISRENDNASSLLGLSDPQKTREVIDSYYIAIQKSGLITNQARLLPSSHSSATAPATTSSPVWKPPGVVYTAMHGVGYPFAKRSYETFGLRPFYSAPRQERPDPDFPTVPFPNPEEKGALDTAMAYAQEKQCEIVLANDPDADRLAVAEFDGGMNKWVVFTGDQIGVMLGHWLWEKVGKNCEKPVAMTASTVSSVMLSVIAKTEGFYFEDTLTGFKWIGHRGRTLSKEKGYRALFGYEEAIGFCCGDVIHDKDGITALSVMTELAYNVYHRGLNLSGHMQSLYDKYGEFVSNNGYYFCYDPQIVHNIVADMRNGGKYMTKVGEYEVDSIRDLGEPGYDSTTPDLKPTLPTSKSSPMITLRFTNGCVAQFRASGTEPKFKYYIEMRGKPGTSREVVTEELRKMSKVILETFLKPDMNGLVDPNLGD